MQSDSKILESLSRSTKSQVRIVKRATIFIMSSEGKSDSDIASAVNLHVNIIDKGRRRFAMAYDTLAGIEKDDPDKLKENISKLLSDNPRTDAAEHYETRGRWLSLWSVKILRITDLRSATGVFLT